MAVGIGRRQGSLLLERDEELAAIDRALASAQAGSGAGLLVRGPAGIGKSVLLGEARRRAQDRGLRVLAARGGVLEVSYPFGVARQLLGDAADVGLFAAAPDAAFAAIYGLYRELVNTAAEAPLLVCVDDLHWADEPSTRLLDFAWRRIEDEPIVVLAALRTGESSLPQERGAMGELESAGLLGVLEPALLTESGVLALTRTVFGPTVEDEFSLACHARTAGNPFFLTELLRELAEEGIDPTAAGAAGASRNAPRGSSRVVLARLARLGHDAAELARAVALLGDEARLADAAELAGLTRQGAVAAVEALVAAGVFGAGEGLSFEHPLMRDAVQSDLADEVVSEGHARAADVLAAHGRDPETVAAHTLASAPVGSPVAVERLRAAARIASERAAPGEAAALLTRALAEPPPSDLLVSVLFELGLAEAAAQRPEAIEHLTAAHAQALPGLERARVALALARMLMYLGRSTTVYDLVADAQAGLGPSARELALALQAVARITTNMHPGGARLNTDEIDRFSRLEGTTPAERSILACVAFELVRGGHPLTPTLALADRAIAGGGCDLRAQSDPIAPLMLITVVQWAGQLRRAEELTSSLMDQARALGSPGIFTEAIASRATTRWRAGELHESEADARQSLETEGMLAGGRSPVALSALAKALAGRGAASEALGLIHDFELPPGREDRVSSEIVLTTRGRVEIALGQYEEALASLTHAGRIAEAAGTVNPASSEWGLLASEALIGLGRHQEARELLAPALAVARRSGGPWELGTSTRTAALAEHPVSLDLLRDALAVLEPSELRLEYARTLIELGAALRRAGSRREAREPLAEGLEIANSHGAMPLLERARTELRAAGARPRRIERSGVEALTPSERRVAALAGDGQSNREIAQQLFVSPRTVEAHLRSSYTKLGIASRTELPRALAGGA